MPLSWNEIKSRALAFSKKWENESAEDAEAKTVWDGFFNVFGITRKRVASFEKPVKILYQKFIWKTHKVDYLICFKIERCACIDGKS